jgi:TRAP-type mannitol/chloroaromatic compound transport system permease small subunit
MQRFLLFADQVSTWVGKTFSWSIVVLTVVTVYDVTARYVFDAPTTWAYDTEYILYGTLFIMAGAYTLSRNGHVRGDVLYRLMPTRLQGGIDLVLYVVFFFPGVLALLYSGYDYARMSWLVNEHSSSSPAGPPIYPFKMLIPIAAFFLIIQGIAESIRAFQALRTGSWPQRLHDVEELEKAILEEVFVGKGSEEILDEFARGKTMGVDK